MTGTDLDAKLEGLLRLKLTTVMYPFRFYGLQDFVPPTIEEIAKICKWYHQSKTKGHVEYISVNPVIEEMV